MVYCWLNLWTWNYRYTGTEELRTHRAWGLWKRGSDEHVDGIPSLGNDVSQNWMKTEKRVKD